MSRRTGSGSRLEDLLFWRAGRTWQRNLALTVLSLAIALTLTRDRLLLPGEQFDDGHALESMDIALNRAFCGRPSHISSAIRLPHEVHRQLALREVPLSELIAQRFGSVAAYCGTVTSPLVNNENSLMLIETAMLRLRPSASIAEIGRMLQIVRLMLIAIVVAVVVDLGASVWFATSIFVAAVAIFGTLSTHVFSAYPFLTVLVTLQAALYVAAVKYQTQRLPSIIARGITAGLLVALTANMRTSYLPIALAMFTGSFAASVYASVGVPRLRRAGVLAIAFTSGFFALHYGLLSRHFSAEQASNASHSIAHPLVLALAVPETSFTQSIGVRWLDQAGVDIARRIDPDVGYRGPVYDSALMTFYRQLWASYPREMFAQYWLKFSVAGTHILQSLRWGQDWMSRSINILMRPYDLLPNGVTLLALLATLTAAGAWRFFGTQSPASLLVSLLSAAAMLVQIESGAIYSIFTEQYHNYLAFYVLVTSLAGLQALVNAMPALVAEARLSSGTAKANFVDVAPGPAKAVARLRGLLIAEAQPPLVRAVVIPLVTCAITLWLVPQWLQIERATVTDANAASRLDIAVASASCRVGGGPTPGTGAGAWAIREDRWRTVPLIDVIAAHSGSLSRYCGTGPAVRSSMDPLIAAEAALLRLRPMMSAAGIGRSLHLARVTLVVGAMMVLAAAGGGWIVGLLSFASSMAVLVATRETVFSIDPWAMVLVLYLAVLTFWRQTGRGQHNS